MRVHGRSVSSFPQGQVESGHLLLGRAEIHRAFTLLLCFRELLSSCKRADKYPAVPSPVAGRGGLAHTHTITLLIIVLVAASPQTRSLMGKVVLKTISRP